MSERTFRIVQVSGRVALDTYRSAVNGIHMHTDTDYTEAVSRAVREAITQHGTTVNAVAIGTGMTRNTFLRRLNGGAFNVTELDRIAKHLGIPVQQLTGVRAA